MRRTAALAALFVLPGCAAALPAAAVAVLGGEGLRGDDRDAPITMSRAAIVRRAAGLDATPAPVAAVAPAAIVTPLPAALATAPPLSTYAALAAYVAAVPLSGCGGKPPALVLDIDEGAEVDDRWQAAEGARIVAAPGAAAAVEALRAAGVAVIFSSSRSADNAVYTEVALDFAGLGPAQVGDNLWLDDGTSAEARGAALAARYCVIATGGDSAQDFAEDGSAWGEGRFLLPNPLTIEPAPAEPAQPVAAAPAPFVLTEN